jgi:hypothetical protein
MDLKKLLKSSLKFVWQTITITFHSIKVLEKAFQFLHVLLSSAFYHFGSSFLYILFFNRLKKKIGKREYFYKQICVLINFVVCRYKKHENRLSQDNILKVLFDLLWSTPLVIQCNFEMWGVLDKHIKFILYINFQIQSILWLN